MGSLGKELKAAREKRGLELSDISEKTRISRTFLQALEDEEFSVIPGDVFVRGFLRTYARELGLDERDLIALYNELTSPKPAHPQVHPDAAPKPPEIPAPDVPPPTAPAEAAERPHVNRFLLWVLVVAVAVTGVSAYLTLDMGPSPEQPYAPAPATPAAPEETPMPPDGAGARGFPAVTTVKPEAAPAPKPAEEKKAPLVLKLTALGDTWYSYSSDGAARVSGMLYKGREMEVEAERSIRLDLGNAGGAKAVLNGRELEPLGKTGAVVRDILFTAEKAGAAKAPGEIR